MVLASILLFLFLSSFFFGLMTDRSDRSVPTETASRPFPNVVLEAKAAYVYDVRNQTVLFAKNEDTRLPLASLTKIMSALVAKDLSPLHSTVTISNESLQADGDSGFHTGERWKLKDIIDFSLITSSNDGIRAVALSLGAINRVTASPEEIIDDFVGEMNIKAGELGLKNTYFWNESGLDLPVETGESMMKNGAYGTARDVSTLLEHILLYNPELLRATKEVSVTFRSLDNYEYIAKNTNDIAAKIPGLMISKTGYTNTAGGNLAVVFDPELGRPIIIIVLSSTREDRFADVITLVDAAMEHLKKSSKK